MFSVSYVKMLFYETLLFYYLCYLCLCVPSFGMFPALPVPHPIPDFYAKILAFYANILCYLGFYARYRAWRTVWAAAGGLPVWLGGVRILVRGFTWACSLTCKPDSRFRIPDRLPFPQGTGESSSADHL